MGHISELRISEITLLNEWKDAPVGTLVQLGSGNYPIVALRCTAEAVQVPLLLVLEGQRAGQLLTEEDLGYGKAVDISKIADLVIKDPAPQRTRDHPLVVGKVYALGGILAMWAEIPNSNGLRVFILLTGDRPGTSCADNGDGKIVALGTALVKAKPGAA